jgi:hypothetical protein
MNAILSFARRAQFGVCLLFLAFLVVSCKTTPKIDWDSRVGSYTYDHAIAELGPPDKSAKLSDGQTVAEWIKHSSGGGFSFGVGTSMYGSHGGVGVGQTVSSGYSDKVLRLVFDPDNKLDSWSKNY